MIEKTKEYRGFQLLIRQNVKLAKRWMGGKLETAALDQLRWLTTKFGFSIALGDFRYVDGGWYVTHAGLLRLASRRRCIGIQASQVRAFCDPATGHWVFRATVFKTRNGRGFTGYGDADPSNVSSVVHGAEMRIAETRAVNRALRKAYGIGLCSVEELGYLSPAAPSGAKGTAASSSNGSGSHDGQPRLRDRLCLLIRQYNLDPNLVKAYAAHFCGTQTIKEASRDLVESFIAHLAASAKEDRDGLVCKLNSFAQPARRSRDHDCS